MNDTPPPLSAPSPKKFLQRFALLGKIGSIVLLALLQLIPLGLLDRLLTGRLQRREMSQRDNASFLPSHLKLQGTAIPQRLHKGIYQAVVYDANRELTGEFAVPDFAPFKLGKYDVLWDKATLAIPIQDLRGARETIKV